MLEGTAGREQELKVQGVLEAARDPKTSVSSEQAQEAAVQHARAGGSAAFQFNPDASPEEKAAQAKQHALVDRPHRPNKSAGLASDADDGEDAGYDLPPPVAKHVAAAPPSATTETVNGDPAIEEEDNPYSKTGWAPRFGNPGDKDTEEALVDHQTWLEGKLGEHLYGDWYHNAGIIIFACLASYTVTVIGGGLASIFVIMAVCSTYYRTSIRRVRRNARDDLHRQLAVTSLETDTESLEWINSFLTKFWPIYAPVLCATIISAVDQVLSTSTPAFLDSMRMKSFTLGTKPPRLEHVKTYPRAEDDIVIMDWKFSFTPNDTSDMTARQIKNKVNPKVVLEIRVGKAMISKGMDIIVEDMACTGLMRVKVKLQLPFPHINKVEISFLEPPTFDYVCKPIGGDMLGFDINFIPGLEGFIQEQIHANLRPMMYDPNVFPIEIAQMLAGTPVDQAVGVLQVTFHGAQGLKNPDKFSGTPDPYAVVSINNRDTLGKTKTIQQNANPRWGDTINIILTSFHEPLTIQVYDYNEYRKDKELGMATFNLDQIQNEEEFENQELELVANARARGTLQCDIRFFPVLEGVKLADGTVEPPPESTTGIAKFSIEQAKDLDGTKAMIGRLNPYAVLLLNGKEVQKSKPLKGTNNPVWTDATKELLITDRKKATLGLVVKDDRGIGVDPVIATYQIKMDDMIELNSKGQEWYNLAGAKTGRAKMMLQWKPVALRGALGGTGYVNPIGVMRFHFVKARDLKNLDAVGKSDPYVRLMLSGVQKGRTVTWKNNLNPEFDEVLYVPVHSTREKIIVEVMDEENTQKDRPLGQFDIACSEYVQLDDNGEYAIHDTKDQVISAHLRIGHGHPKGFLDFTAAFYPTINVLDPEEEEREQERNRQDMEVAGRKSIDSTAPSTPTTESHPVHPRHQRSNTAGTITSIRTTATPEEIEMRKALAQNAREQTETDDVKQMTASKIRIGPDDLVKYESGLLVFTVYDGEFAHAGGHLEVVMDDMKFAAYSSARIREHHHSFNDTADAMIRELDLSRITLRLVSDPDRRGNSQDDGRARLTGNTIDTLRRCLYTPTVINMKDEHGHDSRVKVSMRFLPVKMQLDASESFNNQGNLRVEVLDGADLPAADRNGFSDPYCRFVLNGQEVYKTKIQKKTLHPAWNEFFEVPVRSRTSAKFDVNVFDWDFGEKADFLGSAAINLDVLEPFQAQEVVLNLDGKSGSVRLKMLFKPDYVTRSRQGSSTFSGTFAAPGKIIGAPVKGVGKGAHAVGSGILKGASFATRGFKKRSVSGEADHANGEVAEMRDTSMEVPSRPTTANGHGPSVDGLSIASRDPPRTPHQRNVSSSAFSQSPVAESGTASISVVSATGFGTEEIKLEILIFLESTGSKGWKEVYKTKAVKTKTGEAAYDDDTKKITCNAANQFKIKVQNHKSFGGSEDLGEVPFFLNDQAQGGENEYKVGTGTVVVRTSFLPADAASNLAPNASPGHRGLTRLISRRERSVSRSG